MASVDDGKLDELLKIDQLNVERAAGAAFKLFREAPIKFNPTYKYEDGKDNFHHPKKKAKIRYPAWTDRVLWSTAGRTQMARPADVQCVEYGMVTNQRMSDHRPVYACFNYKANVRNEEKYKKTKADVVKVLDKLANDSMPRIKVTQEVNFGFVKFGEPLRSRIDVLNTKHMIKAEWKIRFPKDGPFSDEEGVETVQRANKHPYSCKSWLHVYEGPYFAEPGQVKNITLTCHISGQNIRDICKEGFQQSYQLSETLLLGLKGGAHHFITCTATYLPSSFGSPIQDLIKMRDPIRFVQNTEIKKCLTIPKEVFRLVDYVYRYGIRAERIFMQKGVDSQIAQIRECLDTGENFPINLEVHSVGEALVRFLENLYHPVLPASIYMSWRTSSGDLSTRSKWCREALASLPVAHYNVFIYVISFLR